MSELAIPGSVHPLVAWADAARAAHSIATSLALTAFVPASMKGKPELVTAAILAGHEMGLQPLSSLRSIDLISGVPAMRAIALRGLVQAAGHDVWVESSDERKTVCKGQRKGSEKVQTSTWTLDRAAKLGLTGKDNWKSQPEAMLIARATSECCRLVASDALLGIPYSIEELEDVPAGAPPQRRTAQRKPAEILPTPAEPALDDPDPLAGIEVPLAVPEPEL